SRPIQRRALAPCAVSFTRTSKTVPPFGHKNTIRDDATTSPIIVIIAPSAFSEERRSHVGQTCLLVFRYWTYWSAIFQSVRDPTAKISIDFPVGSLLDN